MAINKKVVWLPYDMDTALGINNEGSLVFGYELEDTDHLEGGADVFNGQDSVVWNNLRDAFGDEIAAMYKTLRSTGKLSYSGVEQAFDEHQEKWSEAIFNEDAWFKYIDPLIKGAKNAEGQIVKTGAYLPMLQGSKQQQRKWWLYNRFRYMDSKYNAGDALSDVIQLRGYAKADITITPYADIYPTVKYGSYLVSQRGKRGVATLLPCPLDNVNDTEIYIYSASQIASVGDLSGLKVGFADFGMATKLQSLKLGDASSEYQNGNLNTLTLGSNVLLQTLDVRNCTALGTGDQKAVNLSGCTNIEYVYFDGTKVTGVSLPNGGILKVLHLPATITSLEILNQKAITEIIAPAANLSTLRIENCSATVNIKNLINTIPASCRVRLIGFYITAENADEIDAILDRLDLMRGLDEQGGNVDTAQVSGEIHTGSLTGAQISEFNARYPYVRVTADHTSAVLTYKTFDGATVIDTETVLDGGNGTKVNSTAREATAQYTFTPDGWATEPNGAKNANALVGVTSDRIVYAAYLSTLRKYTVTFVKASADGGGTLQTISNVDYGTSITAASSYTGATPTSSQGSAEDYPFEGWNPASATVQGNTVFTAKFGSPVEVAEITDTWDQIIAAIDAGTYKTKYKIGNYKPLDLGTEGTINMQIVAFDTDEQASGGTAPLTFIGRETPSTYKRMNPDRSGSTEGTGALGGWEKSEMRTYLSESVYTLIPQNVRNRILRVYKSQLSRNSSSEYVQQTVDKLWIPSMQEIFGYSGASIEGNYSKHYNKIYKNSTDRIKTTVGSMAFNFWWLRSASTPSSFYSVNDSGSKKTDDAYQNRGIALGFCLGLEQDTIEDSWEDIFASEQDGTYSTKYAVGDTKTMTLSTGEKVRMQIAAFDTDERADGDTTINNGYAPITWIAKNLLDANRAIATVGETTWDTSGMRPFLNDTVLQQIPSDLANNIIPVKKYSKSSGSDVQTTDSLWIPSVREVNINNIIRESSGPRYSGVFGQTSSYIKTKKSGTKATWWTRTADTSLSGYYHFTTTGSYTLSSSTSTRGVLLGFCT